MSTHYTDPNWVNACLALIIQSEADRLADQRELQLQALLRPTNETEPT